MRLLIEHETELVFEEPVREHQIELRLVPRDDAAQRLVRLELTVEPETPLGEHVDCFGNRVHRLSLIAPHDRFAARVRAEVETRLANPFDWSPLAPAEERRALERALRETPRLHEFLLHRSPRVPDLGAKAASTELPEADPEAGIVASLQRAMEWIGARFDYAPGTTSVHAPLSAFLEQRGGVCQDFAHLVVALARGWGWPARYVAGYVDAEALGDTPAAGAAQATHAWAEVWIPGAGWRGFDALAGLVANDHYVAVAVGRDSADAAPVRGAYKGEGGGPPPRVRLRIARDQ